MGDPRFFKKVEFLSLGEILEISGASVPDGYDIDEERCFEDVAALDKAVTQNVGFFDNVKYKEQFKATEAGACFVSPKFLDIVPKGVIPLVSPNPYKAYALTAQAFYPWEKPESFVHESAHVSPSAKIGEGVSIGAGAVVGCHVEIGDNVVISPNAVIGNGVVIGDFSKIGANATVTHAIIGRGVNIYTGARIGQDGFGFAIDPTGFVKVPQLGRVIIEDGVEIGANTTIDRGAGPDTVIGAGTWIDNLVQIGHNVKTGRGCVIVAQVGISGSTELGDFVMCGGQVGIAGHLKIGTGAKIAAQSGVMKDVDAGKEMFGSPAVPMRERMKQVALLNRMVKGDKKNS